jgi:hypothetical protein
LEVEGLFDWCIARDGRVLDRSSKAAAVLILFL